MRIKEIAAICKKSKRIALYDGKNDVQWIGNGYAMYPLFKMPLLNEQSVFTIFDIPEDKQESFHFTNEEMPKNLCFNDTDKYENILDGGKIIITTTAGKVLQPLQTSQGIIFIDMQYLKPFADICDTLELYERISSTGDKIYIVAKCGLMLMGVVMPFELISEEFVEEMERLTQQCKVALFNKKEGEGGDNAR